VKVLERYQKRFDPQELSELARQFPEFANTLEQWEPGGKKRAKE
jgi:hypothetical protein